MAADGKGFSGSIPGSAAPPPMTDLPPSYDDSQSAIGAGGFQVPPQPEQPVGATAPGPPLVLPHSQQQQQQQQQPPVVIQYVGQAVSFGPDPQEMTCPKCQSRIRTTVDKEPGAMAWIVAGVLCFTGFWCCACIPCCIDSFNDVEHSCPSCKKKIGKYKSHSL